MTDLTPEKLAELRAVAEAATQGSRAVEGSFVTTTEGSTIGQVWGVNWKNDQRFMAEATPDTVLALIEALEAKTAEVDAKADYVSDLEERVRQRDNHVIPVLHARIKEAERERDEARAEVDDLAADPGHKAAKYWKWWQREKARADRAETALERVRALHQRRLGYADDWDTCTCGYDECPCPTIQAIEGAEQ